MMLEFKGYSVDACAWTRSVWILAEEIAAADDQDRCNGADQRVHVTLRSGKMYVVAGTAAEVLARMRAHDVQSRTPRCRRSAHSTGERA